MQNAAALIEAVAHLRAGSPDAALARFRTLLLTEKSDAVAFKLLGDQLMLRRDYPDALLAYDQALSRQPNFAFAHCNAALAHKALGAFEDADRHATAANAAKPGDAAILNLLGEIAYMREQFEQSIAHYKAVLAVAPDDPKAPYHLERAIIARDGKMDDPATVFSAIYANAVWGSVRDAPRPFFSGEGSHASVTVRPYVTAVTDFLHSLGHKPDVVDIGCGDFNIGSKIRPACGRYLALDVVADLVAYNAAHFAALDVEFAQLDVTREAPPPAEVYFIREVFQHLTNAQIARALANIEGRFRHLIFTEAVPKIAFKPNVDKSTAEKARVYINDSGVVLTAPPFNARFARQTELCRAERADKSVVVTWLYSAA